MAIADDQHLALAVGSGVRKQIRKKTPVGVRSRLLAVGCMASGAGIHVAAKLAGVSIGRLKREEESNAEFASMMQEARDIVTAKLEAAMYSRAIDGVSHPIINQGTIVGEKVIYSDTAAQFLLKGYDARRFNTKGVEITGGGGGPIQVQVKAYDDKGMRVVSEQ